MPTVRNTLLAVATVFVATVHADYYINPKSVDEGTRETWCANEKDTCPIICQQTKPGTTLVNECDPGTLTYGCLCGDNKRPNVSEYTLTLPYFVCQEWGNQCVTGCDGDNTCASSCREDHPCGATDPTVLSANATKSASATAKATASQSDDGTTIYTGSPGGDADGDAEGDDEGGAVALSVGRSYGLAVVLGSMFVGFALL